MQGSASASNTDQVWLSVCLQAEKRGLRLREFFHDFDRLKHGSCSQRALDCVFTQLGIEISAEQRGRLLAQYSEPPNSQFRYRDFLRDCEAHLLLSKSDTQRHLEGLNTVNKAKQKDTWTEAEISKRQPDVILMLQAQVYEHKVNLRESFLDFDRLRKGFIPSSKLTCVLSLLNFHATPDDIRVLTEFYACGADGINYRKLCDHVEKDLICGQLEKNPTGQPPPPFDLYAAKEGKKPSLSANELDSLTQIEEYIRRRCRQRGVNLLPELRSYDRYNRLVITSNQFSRAMTTSEFNLQESDLAILFKKYCIHGALSRFAYRDFWGSIDS
jgi:Ca2+-binding EF-hand superfamily protein